MREEKTNVMRLLEQKKVPYTPHQYAHSEGEAVDGATVAGLIGKDPAAVFKTLVTRGAAKANYVFVIPVLAISRLRGAQRGYYRAMAVGEKSIEMIPVKELTPLTGYVRGGCSPLGMKKRLRTVLDSSARAQAAIVVSAGKIGYQVELSPQDLAGLAEADFAPVTRDAAL